MDGGSVKETPEQRALAEHASNLMADYRQRLLPVQQRMIEATKTMVAQHGRAAYYQEKSRDKQDPGATVGMLIFKSLSDYVKVG